MQRFRMTIYQRGALFAASATIFAGSFVVASQDWWTLRNATWGRPALASATADVLLKLELLEQRLDELGNSFPWTEDPSRAPTAGQGQKGQAPSSRESPDDTTSALGGTSAEIVTLQRRLADALTEIDTLRRQLRTERSSPGTSSRGAPVPSEVEKMFDSEMRELRDDLGKARATVNFLAAELRNVPDAEQKAGGLPSSFWLSIVTGLAGISGMVLAWRADRRANTELRLKLDEANRRLHDSRRAPVE